MKRMLATYPKFTYMNHACLVFLTILLMLIPTTSKAQTKIFEKEVNDDVFHKEKGQNLKKFNHFYFSYGTPISLDENPEIKYGLSNSLSFGLRNKRKIAGFYAVGFDVNVRYTNLNLQQNPQKIFPDTVLHAKEVFRYSQLNLELYQRFNLGRAGNMIRFYFDTGIYGGFYYNARHKATNTQNLPSKDYKKQKIENRDLQYLNRFQYGAVVRFGYNKFAITANYRLSDMISGDYTFPELPKFTIGLELGIFK